MKNYLPSLILCTILFTPLAFAESHEQCERKPKLVEKLNLTDDRKQAVEEALQQFHEQKQTIQKEKHQAMKALFDQQKEVFEELLTDEEMQILMEEFNKRGKKREHWHRNQEV